MARLTSRQTLHAMGPYLEVKHEGNGNSDCYRRFHEILGINVGKHRVINFTIFGDEIAFLEPHEDLATKPEMGLI